MDPFLQGLASVSRRHAKWYQTVVCFLSKGSQSYEEDIEQMLKQFCVLRVNMYVYLVVDINGRVEA